MKIVRKIAVTAVASLLSMGLVSIASAPAHADLTWGCGGCKSGPPNGGK